MTYDVKCLVLASQFLSDYRHRITEEQFPNVASALAEQIQQAVEDFLVEYE